jgi:hypothetical protein
MAYKLKIEGIYDQRTFKILKAEGVVHFGFDFSPRSLNFIQEHIFINDIVPLIGFGDHLYLHFAISSDPMIDKVFQDLVKSGVNIDSVYLICDEWTELPSLKKLKYFISYFSNIEHSFLSHNLCMGIIFEYQFFEDLKTKNIFNDFIATFFTRFNYILHGNKKLIVKMDWNNNVIPDLFEAFDFDLVSFPISAKVEICYRNVKLKKMSNEMILFEKNSKQINRF